MYLAGTHFILYSDQNPLTHLRSQEDPRGIFVWWIAELEEYDYSIYYVPGKENFKADALSRNHAPAENRQSSDFENKIYALFVNSNSFTTQFIFFHSFLNIYTGLQISALT